MKEYKLEICNNMYGNMMWFFCLLFFCYSKFKIKGRGGIIPKLSLEGAPYINFIL